MKKLLFGLTILAMVTVSCGQSAEEKEAAQDANEVMVDDNVEEVMETMEAPAEEAPADSTAAEPAAAE